MSSSYTTRAREGESHPLQVAWCDEIGRPLAVQNVVYNVFYYVGAVRTALSDPDVPMVVTDQAYRFISQYEVPEGLAGYTLFVEYKAELVADGSTLVCDQVVQIEKAISSQKLFTSF